MLPDMVDVCLVTTWTKLVHQPGWGKRTRHCNLIINTDYYVTVYEDSIIVSSPQYGERLVKPPGYLTGKSPYTTTLYVTCILSVILFTSIIQPLFATWPVTISQDVMTTKLTYLEGYGISYQTPVPSCRPYMAEEYHITNSDQA